MKDTLGSRLLQALFWIGVFALVWWFAWRPTDHWVSITIVGAILVSHLPPSPWRHFVSAAAWAVVAALLFFVVKVTSPIALILLGIGVVQGIFLGVQELKQRPQPD